MGRISISITVLLASLSVPAGAQEEVYRSTDEDGTPSFSDTPQRPDAERFKVPEANVVPSPKAAEFKFDYEPATPEAKYGTLEITSPEDDAVVYIRTTNIPIQVNAVPPVRTELGHRMQITFDGEVLVEGAGSYTLGDAFRGTHTIGARIVDKNDKPVAESKPVKVHIKKPTVN